MQFDHYDLEEISALPKINPPEISGFYFNNKTNRVELWHDKHIKAYVRIVPETGNLVGYIKKWLDFMIVDYQLYIAGEDCTLKVMDEWVASGERPSNDDEFDPPKKKA